MAGRIRTIKPELLEDEKAAELSDAAWRLFVSSWLLADDHGRFRAGGRYLAASVWQDTTKTQKAEKARDELRDAGRINVYEIGGDTYAEVPTWARHQRIDNAGKERIPPPPSATRREIPRLPARQGPLSVTSVRILTDDSAENLGESPMEHEASGEAPRSSAIASELAALPPTPTSDPDLRPRPPTTSSPELPKASKAQPRTLLALTLSPAEAQALQAIEADPSLSKITADPATTARDLVASGPGVDVALAIRQAGAWLRSSPRNAKKNGAKFLLNWITKNQESGRGNYPSNPRTPPVQRSPGYQATEERKRAEFQAEAAVLRAKQEAEAAERGEEIPF